MLFILPIVILAGYWVATRHPGLTLHRATKRVALLFLIAFPFFGAAIGFASEDFRYLQGVGMVGEATAMLLGATALQVLINGIYVLAYWLTHRHFAGRHTSDELGAPIAHEIGTSLEPVER